MTRQLSEPFGVLYVLIVSRVGIKEGRYQSSEPCSREELEEFLNKFQDYFEGDARLHLWIFSLPDEAQIIYDNHNVIYAYGPLDKFRDVLDINHLSEEEVIFPAPHIHMYNSEFDANEQQIMSYWD